MRNPFEISNKVVVITGGSGRLGRDYVAGFLELGARVVSLDLPQSLESVCPVAGCEERFLFAPASVTERRSLEAALELVVTRWGPPEVLINNAGLDSPPGAPAAENGPFEEYPEESWERVLGVNLKGVFLSCQVFGGAMAKAGRGSVINVGSIYGSVSPDQSLYEFRRQQGEIFFKPVAYSASKSGILNLTRYLSTYWGPKGVRVNTVTLAGVFDNQEPAFLANYCRKVPLGRMAAPGEYLGAMLFLASDASSYMTGANLVLDGGYTAW